MARAEGEVRVVIYDQEYRMRSRLDPEYLRKLGEFVDAKMRGIAARTQTVDSLRVAVLAALNIADEHHQLMAAQEAAAKQVEAKVGEYVEILDQLLKQAV